MVASTFAYTALVQWQECVAENLMSLGLKRRAAFPSLYFHAGRHRCTLVQGDDYVSVESKANVQWLQDALEKRFEIKTDIIGHADSDFKSEGKILDRLIKAEDWGWYPEADPRRAELLTGELGIDKGLATRGFEKKTKKRKRC